MIPLEVYELAKSKVKYNACTGEMRWSKSNKLITSMNGDGYLRLGINFNGRTFRMLQHKLAWFITFNEVPEFIDHPNRIRSDNRLCNLRECTQSQNAMNRVRDINTKTGLRGVTVDYKGRYLVRIQVDGKRIVLGRYDDFEEAKKVRMLAEKAYFKEFRVNGKS
jgi:hypothetical protein